MGVSNIISLLSGIALFLFGMSLMGDGLKKVAGNRLEVILFRLTGSPFKGFLLGAGVTAVIQSSSATSVMVVGFVNSGMMKVRQAIAIVMGAILGTSITGWVICLSELGGGEGLAQILSTATLTGVISVAGISMRMFSKSQARRHLGDILMGFAVLMFGMSAMSGAVSPLRQEPTFIRLLTTLSNPFLGIAFGTLFTCLLQSASASVGILQALASAGLVDFSVALPIIMGIAIGAAAPVLLSAMGASIDGKRTALVYLVVELLGVLLFALAFYSLGAFIDYPFTGMRMTSVSVALINTLFRLVKVLVLLPFTVQIEKLVNVLVKDKEQTQVQTQLEERFIQHPALAIEQSRMAIHEMAAQARINLCEAVSLLDVYSEQTFDEVVRLESSVDRYEDLLGSYLVKLTGHEMTRKQNEEVTKFLHTISDFERISDHALNIAEAAKELNEKGLRFSDEGAKELAVMVSAIGTIINLSVDCFVNNDLEKAKMVEPLEECIDDLCDEMKLHHAERLRRGECTLTQGFVFNDLLTNYERVADHCSNIAVAMIELESDTFDTHEYLNSLKKMRSDEFIASYEKFSAEFRL